MNCIEYYKEKYGIDISVLPSIHGNFIASCFLEHIYFPKEELEEDIRKTLIDNENLSNQTKNL